ncbi:hypothetical protein [Streptomyces sp. NBC_00005]|uniref:hypothetical protein n=1 Tax=Streptomyces sp. NBC_00005 TaxID=2903609 RepID=UPI003244DF81
MRSANHRLAQRRLRREACTPNCTVPTLRVQGGLSDVSSEENARAFLDRARRPNTSTSPTPHTVAGDRNDMFADAVVDFLSRAVPTHGTPHGLHVE